MAEKTDRRIRKTRAQLRKGLAELMQEKSVNEITVKELVERVDINRSTFYLHYTDIYNMLDSIEKELFEELETTFQAHAAGTLEEEVFPFIEDVFSILEDNRDIVSALLGAHGDIGFLDQDRVHPVQVQLQGAEKELSRAGRRSGLRLFLLSHRMRRRHQGVAVRPTGRQNARLYGRPHLSHDHQRPPQRHGRAGSVS